MLRSVVLGSGSSGNSYFFESGKRKVLVDVGFSFSKLSEKLNLINVDISEIDSIFITHEHSDHIKGFESCFKKLNCDFYMSESCFDFLKIDKKKNIKFVKNHEVLVLDDLKVLAVEKSHDVKEPLSFVFESDSRKHGVFTDLGMVGDEILHLLKNLDVVYFEANYCEDFIKKNSKNLNENYLNRLVSDFGHLSINQCCSALENFSFDGQIIVLSHVSRNTNSYENCFLKVSNFLDSINRSCDLRISFQDEVGDFIE